MKNSTKSFINLVYLCCAIGLAVFILTLFGRLVGAALALNVKEGFPFYFRDVLICLELTWLGLPAGLVICFFITGKKLREESIVKFAYLLKGWLIWDFEKPFPFGKKEIITTLKISSLGIPVGMVFWIFGIR